METTCTIKSNQIKSNQIKCSFNRTIVKPQLYNTRQNKTIQSMTVTKQHSNYKITISEMRHAARKLPMM